MKDFIKQLEQEFDKQLADKTNYGRNQVKEHFLRACINVLATQESGLVRTPEKIDVLPSTSGKEVKRPKHKVSSFPVNAVEDAMFIQYKKVLGDNEHFFEIYGHDMEFICDGWTSIDNPSEEDMLQLYNYWKDQLPF